MHRYLALFLLPLAILSANEKNTRTQEPVVYETNVTLRDFAWGTSQDDMIRKMGKPISKDEIDGMTSLMWENVEMNGYMTYMQAYFSKNGLEGGTYYFLTYSMDELMRCYTELKQILRDHFGPTPFFYGILRELRPYQCLWELPGGNVHLKVNTRQGDPVTLWYTSPALMKRIIGG